MTPLDFWKEVIGEGADQCDLTLTDDQLKCLAESAESAHENYGMSFYSPPPSDRIAEVENEWKAKLDLMTREFRRYRENAETAVKQALGQYDDANVSIGEGGEVHRYGGRTERIQ